MPPVLQWSKSEQAKHYFIQIADDTNFSNIIFEQDISQVDFDSTQLTEKQITKEQKYCWRLFSIATDGERGPASESRCFDFVDIPEKIKNNSAKHDSESRERQFPKQEVSFLPPEKMEKDGIKTNYYFHNKFLFK